jgi:GTPase SAR1 family protein
MDLFLNLDAAINKLGRAFLWGKIAALNRAKESLAVVKNHCESLEQEKSAMEGEKEKARGEILKLENKLESSLAANTTLENEVEEKNVKIKNFDLVSDALKAETIEDGNIFEFENLIKKNFVDLCDIESNLNDTKPLQKLEYIQKEMQLIANCPALHSKSLGAIGGGFSSGKSSFVNSFLTDSKVRLAEGINPVTAIPSYVICDNVSKINGISYKGGRFDISLDMYKAISHEFLKSFSFNLKEIILYATVLVPMEKEYFGNLCLIDTPGYNAPSSGTAEHDFETAREYIKDAEFLIWMVGLDTNGTIPKSDLDFLDKLDFGKDAERPLYIVANKAELKTESDIEDILDAFEDCLDDQDLQYSGICAYSSKTQKIYASRKMDVKQFLETYNKPSQKYEELTTILHDVFSEYITEIHRDYNEKETKRKEVMSLLLKAFAGGSIGMDESTSELEDGLNGLVKYFQSKEDLEKRLQRVKNLRESFVNCLNKFCEEMGVERTEYVFCTNCGKKLKKEAEFCTECGTSLKRKGKA